MIVSKDEYAIKQHVQSSWCPRLFVRYFQSWRGAGTVYLYLEVLRTDWVAPAAHPWKDHSFSSSLLFSLLRTALPILTCALIIYFVLLHLKKRLEMSGLRGTKALFWGWLLGGLVVLALYEKELHPVWYSSSWLIHLIDPTSSQLLWQMVGTFRMTQFVLLLQ